MKRGTLALVFLLFGLSFSVPSDAASCLNRAERQTAIANGQVLRLNDALRVWRRNAAGGRVLEADLCYIGVALAYSVKVLEAGGKTRAVLIDAKTGQIMSLK